MGASFQAKIVEDYRAIFWAYPNRLQNTFGEFVKYGLPENLGKRYREIVANLPGFNREDILSKAQPVTMFDNISEETIRKFLTVSNQLVNDWRATS